MTGAPIRVEEENIFEESMKRIKEISDNAETRMQAIREYSKALRADQHNSKLQRFIHKFCRLFTLGFPPWDSQVEPFGEAPNCIPLFHMTCKWCGYKWNEEL
jgi:hypothetical protein